LNKFLIKHIPNESEEERAVRQSAAFAKFQAEIELLKIRASRHENKLKAIEEEMKDLLTSTYNDEILQQLEKMWADETQCEEAESAKRWETKQKWLEEYEKNFNETDFVRHRKTAAQHSKPNNNRYRNAKPRNQQHAPQNRRSHHGQNKTRNLHHNETAQVSSAPTYHRESMPPQTRNPTYFHQPRPTNHNQPQFGHYYQTVSQHTLKLCATACIHDNHFQARCRHHNNHNFNHKGNTLEQETQKTSTVIF
jgi:tRNA nucleotidyltransferase/poly(A) polymerase